MDWLTDWLTNGHYNLLGCFRGQLMGCFRSQKLTIDGWSFWTLHSSLSATVMSSWICIIRGRKTAIPGHGEAFSAWFVERPCHAWSVMAFLSTGPPVGNIIVLDLPSASRGVEVTLGTWNFLLVCGAWNILYYIISISKYLSMMG